MTENRAYSQDRTLAAEAGRKGGLASRGPRAPYEQKDRTP